MCETHVKSTLKRKVRYAFSFTYPLSLVIMDMTVAVFKNIFNFCKSSHPLSPIFGFCYHGLHMAFSFSFLNFFLFCFAKNRLLLIFSLFLVWVWMRRFVQLMCLRFLVSSMSTVYRPSKLAKFRFLGKFDSYNTNQIFKNYFTIIFSIINF